MPEDWRKQIIHFGETRLTDFIREYFDSQYTGIYACTDLNFYRELENKMQTNAEMRQISETDD